MTVRFISVLRIARPLLALILAWTASCDPAAARGLKDYQRTVWGQQEGAPLDMGTLAQTTDGWLWVGSADGLYRFDGIGFEPYSPPGHPEFAHMRVLETYAAENGDLYVSFFPDKLAVIRHDGRFEPLPSPEGPPRMAVTNMALDRDGSLWTIGDGIRRFAKGRWSTVEYGPEWTNAGFRSILLDQDGRLWAAAPSGVWRLDRARGRFDKVASQTGGLAQSPEGDVWIVGLGGGPTMRLAPSASGKARASHMNAVESRAAGQFAADGTLWALGCPDTACLVHDAAKRRAELQPARDADERLPGTGGSATQDAQTMLEDREGNVWILAHNGLNRFRPKRFLVPGLDLKDDFYSVAADGTGRVWVANTETGKLALLKPDGTPVTQPAAPVYMLASGKDGALLMGDKRAIRRVLNGSVQTMPLPPGPDGKPVDRQLLGILDDGMRLWSGAPDLGAIAWTGKAWQSSRTIGLPDRIYLSQAGGPGQLWLALTTGELVLHDRGRQTRYDLTPVGVATGIFPGEPLIVGGTNGLALLKNGKLQLMRGTDADALRGVSGLAVTADGDRWLNGLAGVVHVRGVDWAHALEHPDQVLRYELFGSVDGYPGRSSTVGRRPTAISGDGRKVWFIGTDGIVGLDSADLRRNTVAPRPVVQEVSTDKARFDASGDIALPPGSDSFRVRFTAPALRQPERTRFEYRLEGVDTDWRDAGTRRTTSYTNVAPGNYVFRVRAINEDGVVSREDAVVRLALAPTLVQSAPFRIAAAVALAALLATLYRLRVRYLTARLVERLEIKLAERERIARTLHDTILQTVQALLLRLTRLERLLPEGGRARRELQTMLDETERVISEGRNQVHELRAYAVRNLEETVRACAADLRELHPEVDFVLRTEGAQRDLHPGVADEVAAIACEALRNAFTHAQAHRIVASIEHGRRALSVSVRDDGRGLDSEVASVGYRRGHWGLIGMRERAGRVGGRVDIDSSDRGTVLTLCVPAVRAYADRAA